MNLGIRVQIDHVPPMLARDIARVEELWQEGLRAFCGRFPGGDVFTAVDAFFAPVAYRFLIYGVSLSEPSTGYAERLRALEPMRAWYAAALAEPWRVAEYEESSRRAGRWTEDLRRPESV